ncbi:sialate O-acetylesterase [Phenylobacterium deserti]|uniref:Sialate O-acetylesterase domain-containing protein n=1 Tax=Phenylobacterium deserti TaxID=1914756 RepID=A0A328AT53_9CAUL|nr:sialate O-acetylesterase [Phenylobacterium deserti]RAK56866.1 hypothetical protein DJ018_02530 [Phenylobacterium deserti]
MIELVVFAGQSNAVGFPNNSATLPAEMRAADPDVRIWKNGAWVVLQPGVNSGGANQPQLWGPEVAFARRWRADHPADVLYIVKVAKGETALAAGPGLDWSPASQGELFAQTSSTIGAARAALARQGLKPRVGAIFWMQGEQDAVTPTAARAYRGNLKAFFERVRTAWGGLDVPIVYGRIADEAGLPFREQVRSAQTALRSERGVAMVDTDRFPMFDDKHFSAAGQLQLGGAFYEAWTAALTAR